MLENLRPAIAAELNAPCLRRDGRTPEDVIGILRAAAYRTFSFNAGVLAIAEENGATLWRLRAYTKEPLE